MTPKSFLQSRTLWFNVLILVLTIAGSTAFQSMLPADWLAYDAVVLSVGNIVLRLMTTQPVTLALPSGANTTNPPAG